MTTVLLIGASRGIGLELAQQYVQAGDRVIATARDDAGLHRLNALGVHQALRVDVANPASISGLAWQLDGEAIDTAIYVAGAMVRHDAGTPPTQQDFDRIMHVNVLGAMQAIPQVAPLVQAGRGGQGGVFAFVSSIMGKIGGVGGSDCWLYRTSKAALNMAVASARHSYPKAALVVLHPGWVQTDMGGSAAPLTVQQSASGIRQTLAALTLEDSGAFLNFDGKRFADW